MEEEPEQCQHPLEEGLSHLLLTLPLHSQQVLLPRAKLLHSEQKEKRAQIATRGGEPEHCMGTAALSSQQPCNRKMPGRRE